MSILIVGVVAGLAVAAYAAYQLFKSKKAVTVASVETKLKDDVAAAKSDIKQP